MRVKLALSLAVLCGTGLALPTSGPGQPTEPTGTPLPSDEARPSDTESPGSAGGPADGAPQAPPMSVMQQLANPAGPGRAGLRVFTRPDFDSGDVALMLFGSIAVAVLCGGGFGLFYCGLFGVGDIAKAGGRVLFLWCILSIAWMLWGYSLAFAPNWGSERVLRTQIKDPEGMDVGSPYIGGYEYVALQGLAPHVAGTHPDYPVRRSSDEVPQLAWFGFHSMLLLATSVPLILASVHRTKLPHAALLMILWVSVVYAPVAHWVWGPGWLRQLQVLDFAGGLVGQLLLACSTIAAVLVLGDAPMESSSEGGGPTRRAAWVVLGCLAIAGGSAAQNACFAGAADGRMAATVINVYVAACAGVLGWTVVEWLRGGQGSVPGAGCGLVAGLSVIAPASGHTAPQAALLLGLLGGALASLVIRVCRLEPRRKPLTTVAVLHGVPSATGLLLVGVLENPVLSSVSAAHAASRSVFDTLMVQAGAIGSTAGWTLFATGTLLLLLRLGRAFGPPAGPEGVPTESREDQPFQPVLLS